LKMNQDPDSTAGKDANISMYRFMLGPSFFFQGIVFLSLYTSTDAELKKNLDIAAAFFIGFAFWGLLHLLGKLGVFGGEQFELFHFKSFQFWFYQAFVWAAAIVFALMSEAFSDKPVIDEPENAFWVFGIFNLVNAAGLLLIPEVFWGQNVNFDDYDDESKETVTDLSKMIMWSPSAMVGTFLLKTALNMSASLASFDKWAHGYLPLAIIAGLTFVVLAYQMFGPNKLKDKYAVKTHALVLYNGIFLAQAVVLFLTVTWY